MDENFDIDPIVTRAPQSWIEALEESRADAAAGRFVDAEIVLRGLRDSMAHMQARQDAKDSAAES